MRVWSWVLLLLVFCLCTSSDAAAKIVVENASGRIDIRASMEAETLSVKASSPTRKIAPGDVIYSKTPEQSHIVCSPKDGAEVNLHLIVPYTADVRAATVGGAINLEGALRHALLQTESGSLRISAPWEITRFRALATAAPTDIVKPDVPSMEFVSGKLKEAWAFANSRADMTKRLGSPLGAAWAFPWERSFGTVEVVASRPARLELVNEPLPANSRIRMPEEAGAMLQSLWPVLKWLNAPEKSVAKPAADASGAQFRSEVRLVAIAAPVRDASNRPASGLSAADFELFEDGQPQSIAFARSGETPFDLVLLLDLSKSAILTRPVVKTAATEFVYLTQPKDKIAIHVLWNSLFQVVSPLSGDRSQLLSKIEEIPEVAGGSPIYDALFLAGLQHPLYRNGEQPAIVVLTDGMDNQFEAPGRGSVISYDKLRAAVAEWPIPIYTLLLPYESKDLQQRGARNMKQLSEVSGGRLFEIASIRDLPVVYEQVEEELRSVYTVGYYPKNQNFDGSWRSVRVNVKRPGVKVRTRAGYRAE